MDPFPPPPGSGRRARRPLEAIADSVGELTRVSWPRRDDTRSHSAAVLAALAVVLVLVVIADLAGAALLAWMAR